MTDFGDVSISDTHLAFLGFGASGQQGIYDLFGGSLFKVVDLTGVLGGRAITGLEFGRSGLSGDRVAFQATFADGSQGIYTADVIPEPGTVALLATASLLLARARRRDSCNRAPAPEGSRALLGT